MTLSGSRKGEVGAHPLVSILITAWGCAEFLTDAVESALAQTYPRTEVIVSVDAGDEETAIVARRFRSRGVKVAEALERLGQYGNKNRAEQLANGVLLKFLDGDDVLEAHAVERLVSAWEGSGGPSIVFGNFVAIDEAGLRRSHPGRWGREGRVDGRALLEGVLMDRLPGSRFGNVTPHLIERTALREIGGFPQDNAGPGDQATFIRILLRGDAAFVEDVVARYRVRSGSMTSRTFGVRECEDYVEMVRRLEPLVRAAEMLPDAVRAPEAIRRWSVWAGGHVILASLIRRLRDGDEGFSAIKAMYERKGLREEFRRFVAASFPRYLGRTVRSKCRRAVGLPVNPPLLRGRSFKAVRRAGRS